MSGWIGNAVFALPVAAFLSLLLFTGIAADKVIAWHVRSLERQRRQTPFAIHRALIDRQIRFESRPNAIRLVRVINITAFVLFALAFSATIRGGGAG